MKLIDADELRAWLVKAGRFLKLQDDKRTASHAIGKIIDHVDKIPAVDAVPVVRCRDCALFEEIGTRPGNEGAPFGYCYHWDYEQGMSPNQVDGNDFCSYGQAHTNSTKKRG